MRIIHYVYVLKSLSDGNLYVGVTEDLRRRVIEHNAGSVKSTSERSPLKLIYCEMSYNKIDALHREKYLKTAWGKRYLKHRFKNYNE